MGIATQESFHESFLWKQEGCSVLVPNAAPLCTNPWMPQGALVVQWYTEKNAKLNCLVARSCKTFYFSNWMQMNPICQVFTSPGEHGKPELPVSFSLPLNGEPNFIYFGWELSCQPPNKNKHSFSESCVFSPSHKKNPSLFNEILVRRRMVPPQPNTGMSGEREESSACRGQELRPGLR